MYLGIHDIEQLKVKKEYAKDKLIERSGESNWRNGRFCYAISALLAYIYDINKFLDKAENVVRAICLCLSAINGRKFIDEGMVDIGTIDSYKTIENIKSNIESDKTRLIRQKSDEWFRIRSKVKVTGSTLFKSIGLDGLKNQKEYFETVICGVPQTHNSERAIEAMKHGKENEINAVATLVGKVMPVLYPSLVFCEEGCVVFNDENLNPFFVVSPDGNLTKNSSMESTELAIEIKCPTRGVHFELPASYLLQCLSEIEALNLHKLLYLS